MKKRMQMIGSILVGMVLGGALLGSASAAGILAERYLRPIHVDGQSFAMSAYIIDGTTYVKLRDVGQAVGFNVYWDEGVQVDSSAPYTGKAPLAAEDRQTPVRQEIAARTNRLRTEQGMEALAEDALLTRAAQVRAKELADSATYAHTRPDGSAYTTVTDCPYVGENLHRVSLAHLERTGQSPAAYAVDSWANSPGHRQNILHGQVEAMGVGAAMGRNDKGEECWYFVQLFLLKGNTIAWVDTPIAAR